MLSLRHPPEWQSRNCEGDQYFSPQVFMGTSDQPPCKVDEGAFQILIVEFPSDTPAGQRPGAYVGTVRSTDTVTVQGVRGARVTAEVTDSNSLPPPKGTTQIVYTFTTSGKTYGDVARDGVKTGVRFRLHYAVSSSSSALTTSS